MKVDEHCVICKEDIKVDEIIYDIPCFMGVNLETKVFHPYHCACLSQWIDYAKGTNCPLCKYSWVSNYNEIEV